MTDSNSTVVNSDNAISESYSSLASQLGSAINPLYNADTSVFARVDNLNTETIARQNADSNLSTLITKETSDRTSDVTNINNAITTLQANQNSPMPAGIICWYPATQPPVNWFVRNGSAFSTAKYPALAQLYPNGVLPDDRGLFIRGYDPQGNNDAKGASRSIGDYEEGSYLCRAGDFAAVVNFNGYQTFSQMNWDTPDQAKAGNYQFNILSYGGGTFTPSTDPNASTYLWKYIGIARPKNRSYLPIIYGGTPAK